MKKRFLSLLTALVLTLTVLHGLIKTNAIDGLPDLEVHGPIKIEGSIISWNPYPGASYYEISSYDEFPGARQVETTFDPEENLAKWSCRGYGTEFTITAFDANRNAIAKGKSGNFPYYPEPAMQTPKNPRWSGPAAWWDSVADAESYKLIIYKNGELIDNLYIPEQNYVDMSMWLMDYDADYTFKVAARKVKHEISPLSAESGVQHGAAKRIRGANRYQTGRLVAEQVRINLNGGYAPLDSVVLANGDKFPDALGGAYLSWIKNAPIILVNENTVAETISYIKNNVKSKANIYVLGGEGAVSDSWLSELKSSYKIERLKGSDRYETNLQILNTTGVPDQKILICTGENFADALSASGVSYPIMLVNSFGLTEPQKEFLSGLKNTKAVILGGTAAVTSDVENELKKYVTIEKRISGSSRYDTSLAIANYFFGKLVKKVVLTTGLNFPDGLTGGLLAHVVNAPLILANTDYQGNRKIYDYLASHALFEIGGLKGYVLGGENAVSEGAVFEIMTGNPSFNY